MNYSTQYQKFHRTDITISAKSLSIFVSPHLNPPLRMGGLAYGTNPLLSYVVLSIIAHQAAIEILFQEIRPLR